MPQTPAFIWSNILILAALLIHRVVVSFWAKTLPYFDDIEAWKYLAGINLLYGLPALASILGLSRRKNWGREIALAMNGVIVFMNLVFPYLAAYYVNSQGGDLSFFDRVSSWNFIASFWALVNIFLLARNKPYFSSSSPASV